jgi:glycosyltransferase involved in cell wall biosynthesis
MIKVLHLTWGLEVGGKEWFLNTLVRKMDASRFVNPIWVLRQKGVFFDRLKSDGYPVAFLEKGSGLDIRMMLRLRQEIPALAPDVIVAHDFTSLAALSGVLLQAQHAPVVALLHGGYLGLKPLKQGICDWLLRKTTVVVAVSEHLASTVEKRLSGGAAAGRLAVERIPYDVDADRFITTPEAKREQRRKLGLPADGPVVLMVARLEHPKDQDSLIRAAKSVCSRVPACRFLFAGQGTRRRALEALSSELGLADRVYFAGNLMDVSGAVGLSDVCALASYQEGLPKAIQEYMAAGKPVVATDTGGVRELIRDGKEGFLVGAGDVQALADKITFLLLQPETAAIMGAKGREAARSRFARDDMLRTYEKLFENLAAAAVGGRASR